VRLEGLGQLKNAMTSSGIEPETFRLSQLRYRKLYLFKLYFLEARILGEDVDSLCLKTGRTEYTDVTGMK
jgi:hypothetical protein